MTSFARSARDRVPLVLGLATAFAGAVNVASALTAELPLRVRELLSVADASDLRLAHALALPAGLALLGVAWPLARRRRRALHLAVALLAVAGVLNVLKGLDVEEAALSWGLAYGLWHARAAFWVRHERAGLHTVLRRCGVIAAGTPARLLGEAGLAEFSLNFAAHGRWLRAPENVVERALAAVLRVADRWFQVERLLRFNQKFGPRWQPRYLLFERAADLPRVALGAMVAEGQLPTPSFRPPLRRDPSPSPS